MKRKNNVRNEDELHKQKMQFELEKICLENERIMEAGNQSRSQPETN